MEVELRFNTCGRFVKKKTPVASVVASPVVAASGLVKSEPNKRNHRHEKPGYLTDYTRV